MLDITGAGAQPPMRSHWKLRPGPQSHKNSEQQCKRYRANTVTANSNTSATGQTAQQPRPAPPKPALLTSNHRPPRGTSNNERKTYTKVIDGEGQYTLQSFAPPVVLTPRIRPSSSLVLWVVSDFAVLRGVKGQAISFVRVLARVNDVASSSARHCVLVCPRSAVL